MFGVGLFETLLILVVALIVLGPKKAQHLAVWLGRSVAQLRKTYGQWNHLLTQDIVDDKASVKESASIGSDDVR